ncbi:MAG: asparagine synthase-related protein [Candidatus Brocadiia bacterium]
MNGFAAAVDTDADAWAAVRRWMRAWIEAGVARDGSELEEGPFRFLGSLPAIGADPPVAKDAEGNVLVFSGYVAPDAIPARDLGTRCSEAEAARRLLDLYVEAGPDALAGLNGRYVAMLWEPQSGTLRLMNDALGMKPVLLWRAGHSLYVSSNLWAIAAHPHFEPVVEPQSVAEMLLVGHQQGNRMLFEGVSVLPPGSVTTFRDGQLRSQTVRNLRFSRERWDWSIQRIADQMHQVLARSVQRRVRDGQEVILPLSGGFDSRVLLGLLTDRPVHTDAVTQHQPGLFAQDARYARRLARAAGVPHRVVRYRDAFLGAARERCVALSGGMYDIHTSRHLSWLLGGRGQDRPVISAFLGGELSSRFQVSDTAFSTPEEQWQLAFGGFNSHRFSPQAARQMLSASLGAELVDQALGDNRRFFLDQEGPFFHRFYHWDLLLPRRRYVSFQLYFFEQITQVRAPFSDLEFVDFVCSLPFAAIHRQQAYRQMIRDHMPALAKIPNTNDLPLLTSTGGVLRDFLATQYKRFVRRPVQKVLPLRRWVGNPKDQYGLALQGESRGVLEHVLHNRARLAPYLDVDRLRRAVRRQLDGDNSVSLGLLGVSAFATALEMAEDPYRAVRAWQGEAPEEGA